MSAKQKYCMFSIASKRVRPGSYECLQNKSAAWVFLYRAGGVGLNSYECLQNKNAAWGSMQQRKICRLIRRSENLYGIHVVSADAYADSDGSVQRIEDIGPMIIGFHPPYYTGGCKTLIGKNRIAAGQVFSEEIKDSAGKSCAPVGAVRPRVGEGNGLLCCPCIGNGLKAGVRREGRKPVGRPLFICQLNDS